MKLTIYHTTKSDDFSRAPRYFAHIFSTYEVLPGHWVLALVAHRPCFQNTGCCVTSQSSHLTLWIAAHTQHASDTGLWARSAHVWTSPCILNDYFSQVDEDLAANAERLGQLLRSQLQAIRSPRIQQARFNKKASLA